MRTQSRIPGEAEYLKGEFLGIAANELRAPLAVLKAMPISVQDCGIGIPVREQAQIFGRFMRAENAQA